MAKKKPAKKTPAKKTRRRATKRATKAPDLHHIAEDLRPLAVPIADLKLDPENARLHNDRNLATIAASLRQFGQVKPIVALQDNTIIAGNGTVEAAKTLGWTHVAATRFADAAQARAYALADNRTAELATWDVELLQQQVGELADLDFDVGSIGFDDADLDAIRLDEEATANRANPANNDPVKEDDPSPVPEKPKTKPGDLWLLGEHRLLCGDSTKAEDVARLMDGAKADLCFTSPPYAQQRDYDAGQGKGDWDALMQGVFGNLPMADAGQVLVNLGLVHRDGEWLPYWDGWVEWMRSQGWRRFGWYVWDQGFGLPGDWNGRFAPSHEFVFHFNRQSVQPAKFVEKQPENIKPRNTGESTMRGADGKTKAFTNPAASGQSTKVPDSIIRVGRQVGSDGHPAQFPVRLPAFVMQSWPGLTYEPFAGSGTTLIAAEQLNRRCYALEISPQYCDVAVKRWENLTGQKASKAKN